MNTSNSKRYPLQGLIRKLLAVAWIVGSFVLLGLPHTVAWSRISAAPSRGTAAAATATTRSAESAGAGRSRIIITNGWSV